MNDPDSGVGAISPIGDCGGSPPSVDYYKTAMELETALEKLSKREKELEQLNGWFNVALNNMVRGLSLFDSEKRLIFCNKAYQEIYELPDALTKRGTSLAKLLRYHAKRRLAKKDRMSVPNSEPGSNTMPKTLRVARRSVRFKT